MISVENRVMVLEGNNRGKLGTVIEVNSDSAYPIVIKLFSNGETDCYYEDNLMYLSESITLEGFKNEIAHAVDKYSEAHVDIIVDHEACLVYGGYHSLNNSTPVTLMFPLKIVSLVNANEIATIHDLAVVEV